MQKIFESIEYFEKESGQKKFAITHDGYVHLYEPVDYILALGGKRIRPALIIATAAYYGVPFSTSYNAAMACELFHNFSLMHDDIMDGAETRRGQKTVHQKFDVNAAILSGDAMMMMAYDHLCKYNDTTALGLVKVFTKMGLELCEGQRLDMDFENRSGVSIGEYIKMITNKTSVLLGACMQFGGILGGANAEEQFHLYEFGKNIGIAFQIQDDILDTFGSEEQTGKRVGGDILNNKKTYLYLKSLELSDPVLKKQLLDWTDFKPIGLAEEEEKISGVKSIFTTLVVEEYANQLKEAYKDLSISHLNQTTALNSEGKEELVKFADFLVSREK